MQLKIYYQLKEIDKINKGIQEKNEKNDKNVEAKVKKD